jgi:hypothetical protein
MASKHPRVKTSHGYTTVKGHSPSMRVKPIVFRDPTAYQSLLQGGTGRARARSLASTGFVDSGPVQKLTRKNF